MYPTCNVGTIVRISSEGFNPRNSSSACVFCATNSTMIRHIFHALPGTQNIDLYELVFPKTHPCTSLI